MIPLRWEVDEWKDLQWTWWIALQTTAAFVFVSMTILFSLFICGWCCGEDEKSKKNQPDQVGLESNEKQPDVNTSGVLRTSGNESAKMTKSMSSAGGGSLHGKSQKSLQWNESMQGGSMVPAPGSALRMSKNSMVKSGRGGRKKGNVGPGGSSSEVLDFVSENDPRYRSMMELSKSGK